MTARSTASRVGRSRRDRLQCRRPSRAAAGLPAVLVPYPHATADHQTKNARHLEAVGAAVVVPEAELERAPSLVEELLADGPRRERMSRAMLEIARPDAAAKIAEELMALASA